MFEYTVYHQRLALFTLTKDQALVMEKAGTVCAAYIEDAIKAAKAKWPKIAPIVERS